MKKLILAMCFGFTCTCAEAQTTLSTTERPPAPKVSSEKPPVPKVQAPTKEVEKVEEDDISKEPPTPASKPKENPTLTKGTAFLLTGFRALPADSATFHKFKYSEKVDLQQSDLQILTVLLADSTTIGKPTQDLGVFMPMLGFQVQDSEGMPTVLFISDDGIANIEKGFVAVFDLPAHAKQAFEQVKTKLFQKKPTPTPVSKTKKFKNSNPSKK